MFSYIAKPKQAKMSNRRDFIKASGLVAASSIIPYKAAQGMFYFEESYFHEVKQLRKRKNENELVQDEEFWSVVSKGFYRPKEYINLENGYFSPMPISSLQAEQKHSIQINEQNSRYMRTVQFDDYNSTKQQLAKLAGTKSENITICRNTTEALDTIIHGYPWQKGDEVVVCHQDYYSVLAALHQEERRHGIKVIYADVPTHPKNDEEILNAYASKFSGKTKMVVYTHLINISGQVLPLKKLIELAKNNGVESLVDAAHSFAQLNFSIEEMQPDYLGTSLHKWTCAPLGLGMMYIKNEHISKIWPLLGDDQYEENDIRKFEHFGTRPVSAFMTLRNAIDFHNSIGAELKENRLKYLRIHWTDRAENMDHIKLNMPLSSKRSSAIGNFSAKGFSPNELMKHLFEDEKIWTVAINNEKIKGVRVTPHLYTSIHDLNQFILALERLK